MDELYEKRFYVLYNLSKNTDNAWTRDWCETKIRELYHEYLRLTRKSRNFRSYDVRQTYKQDGSGISPDAFDLPPYVGRR